MNFVAKKGIVCFSFGLVLKYMGGEPLIDLVE
jgi:hypothetical protein